MYLKTLAVMRNQMKGPCFRRSWASSKLKYLIWKLEWETLLEVNIFLDEMEVLGRQDVQSASSWSSITSAGKAHQVLLTAGVCQIDMCMVKTERSLSCCTVEAGCLAGTPELTLYYLICHPYIPFFTFQVLFPWTTLSATPSTLFPLADVTHWFGICNTVASLKYILVCNSVKILLPFVIYVISHFSHFYLIFPSKKPPFFAYSVEYTDFNTQAKSSVTLCHGSDLAGD